MWNWFNNNFKRLFYIWNINVSIYSRLLGKGGSPGTMLDDSPDATENAGTWNNYYHNYYWDEEGSKPKNRTLPVVGFILETNFDLYK